MQEWEDAHFVTLTVKSCSAKRLKTIIGKVIEGFQIIKNRNKKRYQRGKGMKLIGIKSLECNYNPVKKTYNSHLHIIVFNKEMAEVLVREWLNLWTSKYAHKSAQHIQKVYNIENNLVEIIKYGSKIFTEPDIDKKSRSNDKKQIYIAALDTIFTAMKGRRIFERFGFNLPKVNTPIPLKHKPSVNIKNGSLTPKWQTGKMLLPARHFPAMYRLPN